MLSKLLSLFKFQQSSPKELRTLTVVAAISLSQGLLSGLGTVWGYVYKDDFLLSPAMASSLDADLRIPWIIKPIWGFMSDNLPIFGYKRLSYLLLSSIAIWICLFYFGTTSPAFGIGFALLFLNNIGQSIQAVMGQAILVENAQEISAKEGATQDDKAKAASRGISTFYGMKIAGGTLYSLLIASLLTEDGRRSFIFYSSFVPVAVFFFAFILPETPKKAKREILLENSVPNAQSFAVANNNGENLQANNLKKVWGFLKDPLICQAMILMFLNSFQPGSGQAKFYFFTNKLGFKPDFLGTLNIVASFATMLGVFIYNKFFSTINLKTFYSFSQVFCVTLTLAMVILYNRWNIAWGISDELFMILDNLVTSIAGEVNSLPLLILACRLCPKNIEATVFSILSAVSNTAGILSSQLGAYLLYRLNITADNFDNLQYMPMILAAFQVIPLIVLWCLDIDAAIEKVDKKNCMEEKKNNQEKCDEATI